MGGVGIDADQSNNKISFLRLQSRLSYSFQTKQEGDKVSRKSLGVSQEEDVVRIDMRADLKEQISDSSGSEEELEDGLKYTFGLRSNYRKVKDRSKSKIPNFERNESWREEHSIERFVTESEESES